MWEGSIRERDFSFLFVCLEVEMYFTSNEAYEF